VTATNLSPKEQFLEAIVDSLCVEAELRGRFDGWLRGPSRFHIENMTINVLLVDDNAGDVRLLREILTETNKTVSLQAVGDGVEAMDYLRYQGRFLDAVCPDLIILDLNMPNMGGLEVLVEVKQDPRLKTIPIIVLTASRREADITESYRLMANCYLQKPNDLKELERMVKNLNEFWLTGVTYHRQPSPMGLP
jgi:two-component system, chemotaxis family, response regulator Rcp1